MDGETYAKMSTLIAMQQESYVTSWDTMERKFIMILLNPAGILNIL